MPRDEQLRQIIRQEIEWAALEGLEDEIPDWREITGCPTHERPHVDSDVPYRKWLSTQDGPYQIRMNNTTSPDVIRRSIERFWTETERASP